MKKFIAIVAILALSVSCETPEDVSPVEVPVSENTEGNQGTAKVIKSTGD